MVACTACAGVMKRCVECRSRKKSYLLNFLIRSNLKIYLVFGVISFNETIYVFLFMNLTSTFYETYQLSLL